MKKFNWDEALTQLFEKYGVFFAFGDKQFNEKKKEGIEYTNVLPPGAYIPKENVTAYYEEKNQLTEKGIKFELNNNTKEQIILHELFNHEAFYTWELEDTHAAVKGYGFSYEEVEKVFKANKNRYSE